MFKKLSRHVSKKTVAMKKIEISASPIFVEQL
jgi:hypothetical protein